MIANFQCSFQVKRQLYDSANGLILQADFSYGFDGCGSVRVYDGPTYNGKDIVHGNIIYGGMFLSRIRLQESGQVVFKVPHMASSRNERPILLVDGKEHSKTLDEIFDSFNKEHPEAHKKPVKLDFDGDKQLVINLNLKCSQMDGKCIKLAQGRLGAYCLMCSRSREECHDPEVVAAGMNVDLSTEEINATWEKFKERVKKKEEQKEASGSGDSTTEDEEDDIDWKINTKKIDVNVRSGQTHQPKTMTIEICNIMPPLHCKLRAYDWCLDMMLRFSSGRNKWMERNVGLKKKYEKFKDHYRNNSKRILGFGIFKMKGDTGITANDFFKHKNRENVLKLLDLHAPPLPDYEIQEEVEQFEKRMDQIERFKNHWRQVIQNICVIVRILNSDELVNLEAYEAFCIKTYLLIVTGGGNKDFAYPKIWLFPTVHEFLGHSIDVIKDNGGRGLLNQSEQPGEASHKEVQFLRERAARKIGQQENFEDVFNQLWIASDFTIRSFDRVHTCSYCKVEGHHVKSCPHRNPQKEGDPDDAIIATLTYPENVEDKVD